MPGARAAEGDRALNFTRALLELTVRENGAAMKDLTRIFLQAATLFVDVERRCAALRQGAADEGLRALERDCAAAGAALREGLGAIQLHDITDQRLAHVVWLLDAMGTGEPVDIASVLTEEEERALLSLLDRGLTVESALQQLGEGLRSRGSVELF